MEFAFKALHVGGMHLTLESAHEFLSSTPLLEKVMERIAKSKTADAEELLDHYHDNFLAQPAGIKTTILNYLKFFTDPHIAEVFCPATSSLDFDDIDHGEIICVSIPPHYTVERRYINTLLKLTFYSHALRRFDKKPSERANDNLLILWAHEAQKIVTASEDGMSDYHVVDVIREAGATVVAATQFYPSLIPPMNDERKANVFIANMANRITFCAADEDSANWASPTRVGPKALSILWGRRALEGRS